MRPCGGGSAVPPEVWSRRRPVLPAAAILCGRRWPRCAEEPRPRPPSPVPPPASSRRLSPPPAAAAPCLPRAPSPPRPRSRRWVAGGRAEEQRETRGASPAPLRGRGAAGPPGLCGPQRGEPRGPRGSASGLTALRAAPRRQPPRAAAVAGERRPFRRRAGGAGRLCRRGRSGARGPGRNGARGGAGSGREGAGGSGGTMPAARPGLSAGPAAAARAAPARSRRALGPGRSGCRTAGLRGLNSCLIVRTFSAFNVNCLGGEIPKTQWPWPVLLKHFRKNDCLGYLLMELVCHRIFL